MVYLFGTQRYLIRSECKKNANNEHQKRHDTGIIKPPIYLIYVCRISDHIAMIKRKSIVNKVINTGDGRDLLLISRTKGMSSGYFSWSCRNSTVCRCVRLNRGPPLITPRKRFKLRWCQTFRCCMTIMDVKFLSTGSGAKAI